MTTSAGVGPRATEERKTAAVLARAFLSENAACCCWGTDWPHVDTAKPVDTADLITALDDWRGKKTTRRQITGDLAARLYD